MNITEIPYNRDLTYIGLTTFRDKNKLFGIKRKDRRQHVYILGKSGTTEAMNILRKRFGKKITTRNWNTIKKLLC